LRQLATTIIQQVGWELPPLPISWSPRMARFAGLFVVEKDARGKWHPETRLSIPLLRRLDRPIQVCRCNHGLDWLRMSLRDSKNSFSRRTSTRMGINANEEALL
jgi:hypothetical protein